MDADRARCHETPGAGSILRQAIRPIRRIPVYGGPCDGCFVEVTDLNFNNALVSKVVPGGIVQGRYRPIAVGGSSWYLMPVGGEKEFLKGHWERIAREMSYVTRVGDLVVVKAPAISLARQFDECEGVVEKYTDDGWVVVKLHLHGPHRFRADELRML